MASKFECFSKFLSRGLNVRCLQKSKKWQWTPSFFTVLFTVQKNWISCLLPFTYVYRPFSNCYTWGELIVNGCSEPPVQLFSPLFFRLTILSITMGVTATDYGDTCFIARVSLWSFDLGYVVSLAVGLILETVLFWVSLRGTILETAPRVSVQYILYIRLGKVPTKVKSNSFKMSKLIT